jgi:transcriptional regulator with PAS, ATPase and Fis domain
MTRSTRELEIRPSLPEAWLRIVQGPATGSSIALIDRVTIGAAPASTLVVADPTVSQAHCTIEHAGDGIVVRDLGSRNGTIVNGVAVGEARLTGPATIDLGGSRLLLGFGSNAARDGDTLVGEAPVFRRLLALVRRVARSNATILLCGETGTGKSRLAREIHHASDRQHGPLVTLDCAALPPTLIESELFGHERGAFTGAVETRCGALEHADGGVLFLDEIGELPLALQGRFLRAIEDRTVRRLGSVADRRVDVRLIAASNRDLRALVEAGQFRRDLFFRLDVIRVEVPPLRERLDDVPALARQCAARLGAGPDWFTAEELAAMTAYPWPGNVRELHATIERAIRTGARELLRALPQAAAEDKLAHAAWGERAYRDAKREAIEAFERRFLAELLAASRGNVLLAARLASMDRNHLRDLIARHQAVSTTR